MQLVVAVSPCTSVVGTASFLKPREPTFPVVQSLSPVPLIATPWTAACRLPILYFVSELAQIHVH